MKTSSLVVLGVAGLAVLWYLRSHPTLGLAPGSPLPMTAGGAYYYPPAPQGTDNTAAVIGAVGTGLAGVIQSLGSWNN